MKKIKEFIQATAIIWFPIVGTYLVNTIGQAILKIVEG